MSDAEADKFIADFTAKADARAEWLNKLAARVAHLPPGEREAALNKLIREEEEKNKGEKP